MGIGKKLQILINQKHRNLHDIANKIGVPPSTLYGIIRRDNNKVDIDVLQSIADELNVTLDYFSSKQFNTEFQYLTENEKTLLNIYRQLNEEGQRKVLDIADDMAASGKYKKPSGSEVVLRKEEA